MKVFTKLGIVLLLSVLATGLLWAQHSESEIAAKLQTLQLDWQSQGAEVTPNPIAPNVTPTDDTWDLQLSFDVDAATGAAGNAGAECDGNYYYSTRWASTLIHKYDLDGKPR